MLISKKNNKGFSLVEVIVSMLVLSIVIGSVLTAFSLSAKSNAKTKKLQAAESMMEDLLELAGAVKDSSKYAETCAATFMGTKSTLPSSISTVENYKISGVQKGSYSFDIEISRDTQPAEYVNMNNEEVISFGASGGHSVLIDASREGNRFDPTNPLDTENGYDAMARNTFITLHKNEIDSRNVTRAEDPLDKMEDTDITALIDRDVLLMTEAVGTDKMQLAAYFTYKVPDDDIEDDDAGFILPVGTERYMFYEIFRSAEYDKADSPAAGAEKLDKVYVLFSPCAWENISLSNNVDVRIWDPDSLLGADVFLISQEDTAKTVDAMKDFNWAARFDSSKDIKVSFRKYDESDAKAPYRVDLYCPATLLGVETLSGVTAHSGKLIPEAADIRVEELTITIKDSAGNVLASDSIACLQ